MKINKEIFMVYSIGKKIQNNSQKQERFEVAKRC
jgi:hypothetical protein